jgi:DNA-binding MarR family transcriptional regulator
MVERTPLMGKRQSVTTQTQALREATPEEMRALGHPLRWRILRLALGDSLTNKELADRLGRDPGTVLHHVRTLARAGFLAPDPVRRGARGSVERPYHSTGKSWQIAIRPSTSHSLNVLDAFREELSEAGEDAVLAVVRLGVRLKESDIAELRRRIRELGDEFAARGTPGGESVGMLLAAHRGAGGKRHA